MKEISEDELFEKMIDESIQELIPEQQEKKLLVNIYLVETLEHILNSEEQLLQSDEYLYLNNEKFKIICQTSYSIVQLALEIVKSYGLNVVDRKEMFYTEKVYLQYKNNLFELALIFGQGTYAQIRVVNEDEYSLDKDNSLLESIKIIISSDKLLEYTRDTLLT